MYTLNHESRYHSHGFGSPFNGLGLEYEIAHRSYAVAYIPALGFKNQVLIWDRNDIIYPKYFLISTKTQDNKNI